MNLLVLNRHIHISLLLLFLNFYRFLSQTKQSFKKRDIIFRHINEKPSVEYVHKLICRGHKNPVAVPSDRFKIGQV